jgi:capsule polysaccharide export protein KpsE/RkpR
VEQKHQFNILEIILEWRMFFYKFVAVGTVISVIIAFLLPSEYITFSTVKGSGSSGLDFGKLMQGSGALSSLGAIADIAMPSGGGQVDYLVALLNSKTVQDSVINHFHLKEYYDTEKIEDTREELKLNTVINKNVQAELLSIGVFHKNPETALQITKHYVMVLNQLYTAVNEQSARNNREHLENRYLETLVELSKYEDSLKSFQQKYGVYDIEAQTSAAIKATAELKAQVLIKEVEIGVKKRIFGNNSEEIKVLASELQLLNGKIEEMFSGKSDNGTASVFIPFKTAPDLGLRYVRLYRNVKIYNELIKVIVPMLEQARLQEKRESPSIVVVDKATMPEKKAKPKRMIIVLLSFFGLMSVALMYIFSAEHVRNVRRHDPERYQNLVRFSDALGGDIRTIFRIKRNS